MGRNRKAQEQAYPELFTGKYTGGSNEMREYLELCLRVSWQKEASKKSLWDKLVKALRLADLQ